MVWKIGEKKQQILKQKYPVEELPKLQHVIGYQVEEGEKCSVVRQPYVMKIIPKWATWRHLH